MSEETTVRALTTVPLPPAEAFALFTEEVDAWWRRGPRFRAAVGGKEGRLCFEPGPDGRLVEVYDEAGAAPFVLGLVRAWEPGVRLAFSMGGRAFARDEWTEVEVSFEPVETGTRVRVVHTGFDALGRDHEVWHGHEPDAFVGYMGLWWGDLLVGLHRAGAARTG